MCGIFGYSGKNFNKYKFNILGLFNDSRGGDSCGVFIGNKKKKQIGYGAEATKLYSEYISSGVELDFNDVNFALGHCRKASVGGIGWAQAQPVVLKDDKGNVKFVMIHNGTITNFRELARKYNVEFTYSETDSQVFAKIVYAAGYDVIKEYEGAGAFMFWDSRDGSNTIKVFKGASLYYQHDDDIYIERPLFFYKNDNSIYISSMKTSLDFINDDNSEVVSVTDNILFTICGGKIIGEDPIDRSKSLGTNPLVYNKNYNSYNQNSLPWNNVDRFSAGNEWDKYFGNNNKIEKELKVDNKYANILHSNWTDSIIVEHVNRQLPVDKVYFDICGLYKVNDKLCDGEYLLTDAGYISKANYVNSKKYYFVNGVLMNSCFDYLCARKFCELNSSKDSKYSIEPVFLAKYSATPVPMSYLDPKTETEYITFYKSYGDKDIEYNGELVPYFTFTKNSYRVRHGEIEWLRKTSDKVVFSKSKQLEELDKKIESGDIIKEELDILIEENL